MGGKKTGTRYCLVKMFGSILCVNLRIQKSIESGPGSFSSLNVCSALLISAFVKFLSSGALNWMSVLSCVRYANGSNIRCARCSRLCCLDKVLGLSIISSGVKYLQVNFFCVVSNKLESFLQNLSYAAFLAASTLRLWRETKTSFVRSTPMIFRFENEGSC